MIRNVLLFSLLVGLAPWGVAQETVAGEEPPAAEEDLTIQFAGQEFQLAETGINSDGDFARYFLPGESVNEYTIKLNALLNRFVIGDDPLETARETADTMKNSPQVVFSELLTSKESNQAIFIFGYRYPDDEYQLNLWKFEKRPAGVFRSQVMVAAPEGVDKTAFKLWADGQRNGLLTELARASWPDARNQQPYNAD